MLEASRRYRQRRTAAGVQVYILPFLVADGEWGVGILVQGKKDKDLTQTAQTPERRETQKI